MKFPYLLFIFCSLHCPISPSSPDNSSYLAPYLNKRYELVSTDDNADAIMDALGVPYFLQKVAKLAIPVIYLTEQDGKYTFTSESTFKDVVTEFRIGEKFADVTLDGRYVESVITQDKNILTEVQTGDKTTIIVREFTPEEVKITVTVDDIESVRIFELLD